MLSLFCGWGDRWWWWRRRRTNASGVQSCCHRRLRQAQTHREMMTAFYCHICQQTKRQPPLQSLLISPTCNVKHTQMISTQHLQTFPFTHLKYIDMVLATIKRLEPHYGWRNQHLSAQGQRSQTGSHFNKEHSVKFNTLTCFYILTIQ